MSTAWDETAWQALAAELDRWCQADRRATFWWRDDDAGRDDPALGRLLTLADMADIPLGLAVVPAWLSPDTAATLRRSPPSVGVLQHGWAHLNHETAPPPGERKLKQAELGEARPTADVLAELDRGQAALRTALGARALPVLVPPWNRIAPAVRAALPAARYRALSTFGPRPATESVPGLRQVNCHADPIVWREAKRFVGAAETLRRLRAHLVARRTGAVDPDEVTGLLTHHRDLSAEFWACLCELWPRLAAHPGVAFPRIEDLFGLGA